MLIQIILILDIKLRGYPVVMALHVKLGVILEVRKMLISVAVLAIVEDVIELCEQLVLLGLIDFELGFKAILKLFVIVLYTTDI